MMIRKIFQAIKDGSFLDRAYKRLRRRNRFYYVKEDISKDILLQRKCRARLKKKYHKIIQKGAESAPMEKSNKVWILWLQGEEAAPAIVKACIHSIRRAMVGKEIIVLSENNLSQYITLPEYIVQRREKGQIGNAHYSDLIRIQLLCKYGGIWIDSTVLCTAKEFPSYIEDAPLFVYKAMDLSRNAENSIVASSWLIAAYSNHPILLLTRNLLFEYWKKHNRLIDYFLFHLFFSMAVYRYPELWQQVPVFNNHSPHVLQFEFKQPYNEKRWNQIIEMSPLHKLTWRIDSTFTNDSFYHYIINHYLPKTEENEG